MPTDNDWTSQLWKWCERLIPNDPDFREYVEIEYSSKDCLNITFYSTHERFRLTAAAPGGCPKGVLELIMTDNRKPLGGDMYISDHDMKGHINGDLTEKTFNWLLEHLHERTPWFRRKFVRLRELDNLRNKLGI